VSSPETPVMDRWIRRTVESHIPWSVHFDLTYRCNERCVHCYLDHEDHGELTTAECFSVLEQLAEAGALFLTLSGGEIFLRQDLFELLDFARRLHFDVSLKTNALLITPERAARLHELGVRHVQISVYSDEPAVHDAITKVPGSLARTLAAIPLLLSEGLRVKLACPLMRQNLLAYRGVMALAEKLGVPYVLDLTISPMMDGGMEPVAHRVPTTELIPILQDRALNACHVASGAQAVAPTSEVPEFSSPLLGSTVSSGLESSAYDDIPCSAGHNSCYVSPYGDVFPCVQLPQAAGNLRHECFADIWNHAPSLERLRTVRESNLPLCSRCEIRAYCERCPGMAWMEGGDLLGAYERACELAESRARLAGVEEAESAWHAERRISTTGVKYSGNALAEVIGGYQARG
jgi:AdoMet-dependent heme synthase